MISFGVLGAGRIGKVHGANLANSGRATVAYVADADGRAAAALAASIGAKSHRSTRSSRPRMWMRS